MRPYKIEWSGFVTKKQSSWHKLVIQKRDPWHKVVTENANRSVPAGTLGWLVMMHFGLENHL